ncbi:class I SAM-dependent methyltransferase [Pseudomonas sp. TH05]|uniref:class I SAM-dependent methyltransferase n=1 Tax=unclassified Pseudomonas TaxID=196821 RepID=UPI0019116B75|nr:MULTISPECIES: class I SAM-dependent methyltransferase [unclassified Pseudomonas]MBK5539135.1 class I SAM-dependent methyltransferase [Pseudomonas sp. TH07]MBK5558353.1 class I SAM-dependent methyltransferase [Pseudomonas sp. TH05]
MHALSDTELFLQDFHQRRPGTTSVAFAPLNIAGRGSTYAVLASTVKCTGLAQTVLDIACGDGYLLQLLAEQDPELALIGVDMSHSELAAARQRLGTRGQLLHERAQALSLPAASVDVALSHLALMLMDDLQQVLDETHRVLRPGGQFAAIVGRGFLLGQIGELYLQAFRSVAREHALPALPMGDPRTRSEAGWRELLGARFSGIEFDELDVEWAPNFDELWTALNDTYDLDRLSTAGQALLKQRLETSVTALQRADGTIATGWGLRLIRATAA